MLRAVIDSKASPRKRALTEAVPEEGDLAPREKAGEAFAEIIRHLPRDDYGNDGGVAATLAVTVHESTLRGEIDRAGILPVVMDGRSQVLDEGPY